MSNPVTTTSGVCVHHPQKPRAATCVSCDSPLCLQCVVRTPVGVKCAACTGGRVEAAPARPRRRAEHAESDEASVSRPAWRRRALLAGVAVVVLAAVAVTVFALTRPKHTVGANAPTAARVGSTDVRVQFAGAGGIQLFGILSLPPKSFQPAPAVLIIPDFGSVDRDGITRPGNFPDRLYADMAQSLTARGYASLRYDPRGQGQSVLPSGSAVQLSDLVSDGTAGLNLLTGRQEVNGQKLTIIGHGWGGLVALQLAAQDQRATNVVLVSTPGRPVVDTIADQLQASAATPADGQRQVQQLRSAVTTLLAGGHLPGPSELDPALQPILQQSQEPYLRSLFALVPADLAKQVHVPTLIVRGTQDPAITAADASTLAAAIGTPATVLIASGAGHTLAIASPTAAGPATTAPASNSAPVNVPIVRDTFTVNGITNWMSPGKPPPPPSGAVGVQQNGGTGR
jgi:uncharacterized protein